MNDAVYMISHYPWCLGNRIERAITNYLTATGTLDELYAKHLEQFGDVLDDEVCAELGEDYSTANAAMFNDIVHVLENMDNSPERYCRDNGLDGPVVHLIDLLGAAEIHCNPAMVVLLYLTKKLGYVVEEADEDRTAEFPQLSSIETMLPNWDMGKDFVVIIPANDFDCGWTDAGHAGQLCDAMQIAADYEGSRVYQRGESDWVEVPIHSIEGSAA